MLEIKNNKLLVVLSLFVVVMFFLFLDQQTPEKKPALQDKMQRAMENHDHEDAFIFASSLLELEPGNQQAIKVIKNSGEILLFLQIAQSSIADIGIDAEKIKTTPEKVYELFKKARKYTAKAKFLDADFKTTLEFEERLDEAQGYMLSILAANVLNVGESVYANVFNKYEKKSAIIDSASSSEYLDIFLGVQSSWAPVKTSVEDDKGNFNSELDKMDETSQLVADFKAGQAQNMAESVLIYIQSVKNSLDVLAVPKGSLKTFSQAAKITTKQYDEAHARLMRHLSESANDDELSSLVNAGRDYKLFQQTSTADLINENEYLQNRVTHSF